MENIFEKLDIRFPETENELRQIKAMRNIRRSL